MGVRRARGPRKRGGAGGLAGHRGAPDESPAAPGLRPAEGAPLVLPVRRALDSGAVAARAANARARDAGQGHQLERARVESVCVAVHRQGGRAGGARGLARSADCGAALWNGAQAAHRVQLPSAEGPHFGRCREWGRDGGG